MGALGHNNYMIMVTWVATHNHMGMETQGPHMTLDHGPKSCNCVRQCPLREPCPSHDPGWSVCPCLNSTLLQCIKNSLATPARSYSNILLWAACHVVFLISIDTQIPQIHNQLVRPWLHSCIGWHWLWLLCSIIVHVLLDYLVIQGKAAGPLFQLENG